MQFLTTSDPGFAVYQRSHTTHGVAMICIDYERSALPTRAASSTVETAS
jgi:hypothetical protein